MAPPESQPCTNCAILRPLLYRLLDSMDALDEQTEYDRNAIWSAIRRTDTEQYELSRW